LFRPPPRRLIRFEIIQNRLSQKFSREKSNLERSVLVPGIGDHNCQNNGLSESYQANDCILKLFGKVSPFSGTTRSRNGRSVAKKAATPFLFAVGEIFDDEAAKLIFHYFAPFWKLSNLMVPRHFVYLSFCRRDTLSMGCFYNGSFCQRVAQSF